MKQNDLSSNNHLNTNNSHRSRPSQGYFFTMVLVDEALQQLFEIAKNVGTETIPLEEACGEVLAGQVYASSDIAGFDQSWKDGYAVIAADTNRASEARR